MKQPCRNCRKSKQDVKLQEVPRAYDVPEPGIDEPPTEGGYELQWLCGDCVVEAIGG